MAELYCRQASGSSRSGSTGTRWPATKPWSRRVAARMLAERGHAMVSGGLAEIVVGAVAALPGELRDAAWTSWKVKPGRCSVTGRARWTASTGSSSPKVRSRSAIAWRLGLIHHLRGQTDVAIATYQRGRIDGQQPTDEALLQAWWAGAHWLRGEFEECRAADHRRAGVGQGLRRRPGAGHRPHSARDAGRGRQRSARQLVALRPGAGARRARRGPLAVHPDPGEPLHRTTSPRATTYSV